MSLGDRTLSGWVETLPSAAPARPLDAHIEVDSAIIGAGLTGVAIARRLAELRPDWRIAVFDAQRIGASASGRASGFVVDLTDVAARLPDPARRSYVRLARFGIDLLRRLVQEHDIDCDWDETGWIRAAAGPAGEEALAALPALYRQLEIDFLELDAEAMHRITGSRFYRKGIRLPGYPLVQTAALTRELARILPANVEIYEGTEIRAIVRQTPYLLRSERATVDAQRLFIATNGYTPALGFLKQRIFPVYTFGSFTSSLTAEQQQRLGGESEWGVLAMDPMGSTVRRTRDQRILIRNTMSYRKNLVVSDAEMDQVRGEHRKAFLARFPMLEEVGFEYTWAGLMGAAHNSQISFGRLGHELYAAAAYSAAGIAMSQTAGTLIAELALGVDSELLRCFERLPRPTWMPPEPFRSWGGGFLARRMNRRAGRYL